MQESEYKTRLKRLRPSPTERLKILTRRNLQMTWRQLSPKFNIKNSLADKVERYNTELKGVLDKHAPVKTKTVKITHWNPWFNDKIKEVIRLRREERKSMEQRSNILQLSGLLLPKEVCSKPNKCDQIGILQIPNSRTPCKLSGNLQSGL